MRPERARVLSRRGTRLLVELADDYARTYAPFIQAAVREVGHNYRQVAKWLTRERIPAQRDGQWKAQSVKNLVVRYRRLTGRRIPSSPTRDFRRQRTALDRLEMCLGSLCADLRTYHAERSRVPRNPQKQKQQLNLFGSSQRRA